VLDWVAPGRIQPVSDMANLKKKKKKKKKGIFYAGIGLLFLYLLTLLAKCEYLQK